MPGDSTPARPRRVARRWQAFWRRSRWKARLAALGALGCLAVVVCTAANLVISASERRIIEREAVKVAEVVALQAVAAASVYQDTEAGADFARFMDSMGARSRRMSEDGYSYRWLSARGEGSALDGFERHALQDLEGTHAALWVLGEHDGGQALRYVKGVFREGRFAGAIEVFVPVAHATAFAAVEARITQSLLMAVGLVGLGLVAFLALRSARQHRTLARRYEEMAKVDALTGLPNRLALEDLMRARLAESAQLGHGLGVMFVDVDNFKNVNDSLGHRAGDRVLRAVAQRMRSALRHADLIARYSGDEFVVLVGDARDERHLAVVAAKLTEAVAPVLSVNGNDIFVTLSIGTAAFPADGADAPTLLKHADAAMYRAKEKGRNGHEFFRADMNHSAVERLQMSTNLRHALMREEFLVHYQPKADALGQRIVGFEALVRWQHPEQGLLSPARFIPHAESTGAIEPLGEWVLDTALAQLRSWREGRGFEGTMAVNLSMRQLYNSRLPRVVAHALAQHHIPPGLLELEVTESMMSVNPELAARTLGEISDLGVSIALDDFGTGQSSLSCLLSFPIRTLKVDRTFTRDLLQSEKARSVVRAMIALAHSLRLRLVAEGVETESHREFFQKEGCDEIQGYLIGWPMPADEASAFAFNRRPEAAFA